MSKNSFNSQHAVPRLNTKSLHDVIEDERRRVASGIIADAEEQYERELEDLYGRVDAQDYYAPNDRPWEYAIQLPAFNHKDPQLEMTQFANSLIAGLTWVFGNDSVRVKTQGVIDECSAFIKVTSSPEKLYELAERRQVRVQMAPGYGKGYQVYSRSLHKKGAYRHPGCDCKDSTLCKCCLSCEHNDDRSCSCIVLLPYQRQELIRLEIETVIDQALDFNAGKGLQVGITTGKIQSVFPLHTLKHDEIVTDMYPSRRTVLKKYCSWAASPWTVLQFSKYSREFLTFMRDYLGEKISLYFAFLHFYTTWLLFLVLPGTFLALWQYNNQADVAGVPIYSLIVAIWSTVMLEFWLRRQGELSHRWG